MKEKENKMAYNFLQYHGWQQQTIEKFIVRGCICIGWRSGSGTSWGAIALRRFCAF